MVAEIFDQSDNTSLVTFSSQAYLDDKVIEDSIIFLLPNYLDRNLVEKSKEKCFAIFRPVSLKRIEKQ